MNRGGYTLIEILVVFTILTLMSGILLTYNRTGERQILLFREQAKIISLILRAKSFALGAYIQAGAPCGYGVHFDRPAKEVRIFKDSPSNGSGLSQDCSNPNKAEGPDYQYNPVTENLDPPIMEKLGVDFVIGEPMELNDIVFLPPEPRVAINGNPAPTGTFTVSISNNGTIKTVKVNSFGQISTN
ncbi:MAG: prepilin-type N-terminal cleavage/methylation domain-containing protein [bacterium]|nr:prepilin-type N-terminal cleavage/methylation domain-containing protein [bacterium]